MYFWRLFFYHLGKIKDYFLSSQYSCLRIRWAQSFLLQGYNDYLQHIVVYAVPICEVKHHTNPKLTGKNKVGNRIQFATPCRIVNLILFVSETLFLKSEENEEVTRVKRPEGFPPSLLQPLPPGEKGIAPGEYLTSVGWISTIPPWKIRGKTSYILLQRDVCFCFISLSSFGRQKVFKQSQESVSLWSRSVCKISTEVGLCSHQKSQGRVLGNNAPWRDETHSKGQAWWQAFQAISKGSPCSQVQCLDLDSTEAL